MKHPVLKATGAAAIAVAIYYGVMVQLLKRAEREVQRAEENLTAAKDDLQRAQDEHAQMLIDQDRLTAEQTARHAAEKAQLEEIGSRLKTATDPDERAAIELEMSGLLKRVFAPTAPSPTGS